jgi:hypothetical protein
MEESKPVWLTVNELIHIPAKLCPMMVFSYAIGSPFATAIAIKENGYYNHFMWLLEPGVVASQDLIFKRAPLSKYINKHTMKLVYNKNWGEIERKILRDAIEKGLNQPVLRRLYDPLAIIGQLINVESLHIPYLDICSDKASCIKLVDKNYNLKRPSPTNVNDWTKAHRENGYVVHGRFRLD